MKSQYKEVLNIVANVLLVLGIIGSFLMAYFLGFDLKLTNSSYGVSAERNWVATITYFLVGLLSSGVLFIVMKALVECLDFGEKIYSEIASIKNNTGVAKETIQGNKWNDDTLPPL